MIPGLRYTLHAHEGTQTEYDFISGKEIMIMKPITVIIVKLIMMIRKMKVIMTITIIIIKIIIKNI